MGTTDCLLEKQSEELVSESYESSIDYTKESAEE